MQRNNLDKHKFKKGQSGNPKGAGSPGSRQNQSIRHLMRKINGEKIPPALLKRIPKDAGIPPNSTMLEAVLIQTFNYALAGRSWAITFVAERLEGKIKQPIEISPFESVNWEKLNSIPLSTVRKICKIMAEDLDSDPK